MLRQLRRSLMQPMTSRIIGKIRISGPIVPATGRSMQFRGVTSDRIIQKIRFATTRGIRHFIFEINSPGGAVVASREIVEAVKSIKGSRVAWIRDVGASGAYWVASACHRIVADPCSSVGSIGVFAAHLEFSELMKKHGVGYEDFKAGRYKDMGVPYRKTTDKERKIIQSHLDALHDFFINDVAANRGLDPAVLRKHSEGLVYLGEEARKIGLVDRIGGRAEAVRQCEAQGHFKSVAVIDIEDLREEFLFALRSFLSDAASASGSGFASALSETLSKVDTTPGWY